MMTRSFFAALLVNFLIAALTPSTAGALPPVTGDSATFARIDDYVSDQMDESRIRGAAVAIVKGDQIIYSRGFGRSTHMQMVTPQTPFPAGSLSRSFTALAIMQLADVGIVELDAPVRRYLPGFGVRDAQASGEISIRQLLDQTSGLSSDYGSRMYRDLVLGKRSATLEELVQGLGLTSLDAPAGTSFADSDANFAVLARVIEAVSGQDYGTYLQEHILAPLDMQGASSTILPADLVDLHRVIFGFPLVIENAYLPQQFPGAYLTASAEDLAQYLSMYLGSGSYQGTQLVSASGIEQLLRPSSNFTSQSIAGRDVVYRTGMAWSIGQFGSVADTRWLHGGSAYFNAWIMLLPPTNQAVVVLMNTGSHWDIAGVNGGMSRIPVGIVDLLSGSNPPTGRSLVQFYLVFDLVALAVVIPVVMGFLRNLRIPLDVFRSERDCGVLGWRGVPLCWELGVPLAVLGGFPRLTGQDWLFTLLVLPDLTVTLAGIAAIWAATGIVRMVKVGLVFGSVRHFRRPRPIGAFPG